MAGGECSAQNMILPFLDFKMKINKVYVKAMIFK